MAVRLLFSKSADFPPRAWNDTWFCAQSPLAAHPSGDCQTRWRWAGRSSDVTRLPGHTRAPGGPFFKESEKSSAEPCRAGWRRSSLQPESGRSNREIPKTRHGKRNRADKDSHAQGEAAFSSKPFGVRVVQVVRGTNCLVTVQSRVNARACAFRPESLTEPLETARRGSRASDGGIRSEDVVSPGISALRLGV